MASTATYSPLAGAEESYDDENPFAVNAAVVDDVKDQGAAVALRRPARGVCGLCAKCCDVNEDDDEPLRRKKYCLAAAEVSVATTLCYWFERIIHNKFCDFLFKCNCTWTWAGGWDNCNVWNNQGLPRCPWCTARANVSWTTDSLLFALMLTTYLTALRFRKRIDITARFALPIIIYFLVGTLVGYIFKATGTYPTFIW
jgi:hypothetical protein